MELTLSGKMHTDISIFFTYFSLGEIGGYSKETPYFLIGKGEGGGGGLEKKPPVSQWSAGSCLCIILLTSSLRMVRWPSCECTGPQTE